VRGVAVPAAVAAAARKDQWVSISSIRAFNDGTLIEVKSYFSDLIENGQWKPFFSKQQDLIDQAKKQVEISRATGHPLKWVFAEPEVKALMKEMFEKEDELKGMIEYVVVPPQ
jgi:hypothetical protein